MTHQVLIAPRQILLGVSAIDNYPGGKLIPLSLAQLQAALGHDTRAPHGYLGHKNIQHTVRYTELAPGRFKGFGGIRERKSTQFGRG